MIFRKIPLQYLRKLVKSDLPVGVLLDLQKGIMDISRIWDSATARAQMIDA